MGSVSLQEIVDDLADRVDRAVTASSATLQPLAYSSQPADVDTARRVSILAREAPPGIAAWVEGLNLQAATGPVRTDAVPELGLTERIAAPIRVHGEVHGYLWTIDRGHRLGDDALAAIAAAAESAAAVLERADAARRSGRDRERALLGQLLEGDAAAAARELRDRHPVFGSSSCAALAVRASAVSEDEPSPIVNLKPPGAAPVSAFIAVDDAWMGIAPIREEGASAAPVAEALLEFLADKVRGEIVIGVGGAGPLTEAARSYREALVAADVAAAVPEHSPVARWNELGLYRLVWQLDQAGERLEALNDGIQALLDAPEKLDLPRTLETFLDRGGEVRATAAALYMHRTTLYHRLQRIEEITGLPLTWGEHRTTLHLALKLARYRGQLGYPSLPVAAPLSDAS